MMSSSTWPLIKNNITRVDEDPTDANMLSGADLLASKVGAKVIKESD